MTKPVFKTGSKADSSDRKSSFAQYTEDYSAGQLVFEEGDLGMEMYIVHEGQVEILQDFEGEPKQLAVLEKGDFFGEMALLEDLPRTAGARAITDARLIRINGATFDQMLRSKPEIAVRIMRKLSRRLRQTDELLRAALGSAAADKTAMPELPKPDDVGDRAPETLVQDASGIVFHLSESSETLVGRKDPVTGIHPDVDLTIADGQRSTSRRHAKIYRRNDKYFVTEEIGTMNGTFVNGERIETGVPKEMKDGDEVQFGLVKLAFHVR
jgi:CRP-like cAMP-binding protein